MQAAERAHAAAPSLWSGKTGGEEQSDEEDPAHWHRRHHRLGDGESGLTPELTSQQLLRYIPDIEDICDVRCLQLFSLDSTNIQPKHWVRVADAIRERYGEYDGFVVSHGTDTMAYTAAALSYLIQRSPKPIVLTGAQKPIGFETTDSKQNLRDAFTVAASDMTGVVLVFNGKVILGTRARRPGARASRLSPASTTRCWPWSRTGG